MMIICCHLIYFNNWAEIRFFNTLILLDVGRRKTKENSSPFKNSCKTRRGHFSVMNSMVSIVLATLLNFAYGVLFLCPLVYYSRCLLVFCFFLYYHVVTTLLLFIIFKCTILRCPLCRLHELTWIYYNYHYYYYFECSMSITKKEVFSKGTIFSLIYRFVCVFPFVSFFVSCWKFWWLWDDRQHRKWECGWLRWEEDWPVNTHYIKDKNKWHQLLQTTQAKIDTHHTL